jgi:membrane protein
VAVDGATAPTPSLFGRLRSAAWTGWDALLRFNANDGFVVAGYIAFTMIFSLFPFLIFLFAVGSVLGQGEAAKEFVALGLDAMPPEVERALKPAIEEVLETPRTGLMTVSILFALWFASSGLESLRHAVNIAFGYEHALAMWWARLQSIFLVVLFTFAIIIVMLVIVVLPLLWGYLERTLRLPASVGWIYEFVRYFVGALIVLSSTSFLYRVLPNHRLASREVLPGALAVVVLWLTTASLFSLYLANVASYSMTYGSLGGVVITMMFFYITAIIFILGAEINAAVRRRGRGGAGGAARGGNGPPVVGTGSGVIR